MIVVLITLLAAILHRLYSEGAMKWYTSVYIFSMYLSSLSAVSHMCFIAIQRLIAVLYPLKVSIWITRKRSIIAVLLFWLASVVVAVPVPMGCYIYNRMLIFTPFVSASVIVVCYFVISFKMMTRKASTGEGQQTQNISVLLYSIAITAILIYVYVCMYVCLYVYKYVCLYIYPCLYAK